MLEQQSISTQLYILITLLFLVCYALISSFLQQRHLPIHRSAVAIIVGIIAGFVISVASPSTYQQLAQLDQVIVFSVLFPPMIFAQGYTLHKSVLFKNGKYIVMFGLLGTFLSFIVSWGLISQANNWNLVIDINDIHNFRTLTDWQILLLAACLCSIDTTASEQTVSEYRFPKLYSIIFGEDVMKDTVTIVLFSSILNLQQRESPQKLVLYWYTFFQALYDFIVVILGSLAAGAVSAFVTTFLSRKLRFMTSDKGITQTSFLFFIGFLTYIYTQMLGFSGAISILVYGMLLNHYNIYNMSQQSRASSTNTFIFLSNISEGLLFLIMGIMVWQGQWESPESDDDKMTHSYIFFGIIMLILVIARFVNIYVLGLVGRLLTRGRFDMSAKQMHILFLSGMVRGAVPFVLFSSVTFESKHYSKNEGIVLKTTIIFVIIFTSVILNSIIPMIFKKQLKKLNAKYKLQLLQKKDKKQEDKKQGKLKQFEQKYIKPLLIYDYTDRKQQILQQKQKRKQQIHEQTLAEFNSQQQLPQPQDHTIQ